MIVAIVLNQFELFSVQREFAPCDPVRITADEGTEIRIPGFIIGQILKTKDHIFILTVAIRGQNGGDDDSLIEYFNLYLFVFSICDELKFITCDQFTKRLFLNGELLGIHEPRKEQ